MMSQLQHSDIGTLVPIVEGQKAFVPDRLPDNIALDPSVIYLLDEASRAVATLSGVGETISNPNLLIRPFLRREAVLSSRIEGTQASISDLLLHEASGIRHATGDVVEVANYVGALEHGIERLEALPICIRFINEVHAVLLRGVRGGDKRLGEFRPSQVWIGIPGTPIEEARFIPPPPQYIQDLMADLERFVNEETLMPPLVQCALIHYQIETIHPYVDGNGRIGRLLIPLFLNSKQILSKPLLYISAYFEADRQKYYDELFNTSKTGDWNAWLKYFLKGFAEQAVDALLRTRRVRELHEKYRQLLQDRRESGNTLSLLDQLFMRAFITAPLAARVLNVTPAGSRRILERLEDAGIVNAIDDTRPRIYVARELLKIIESPTARGY